MEEQEFNKKYPELKFSHKASKKTSNAIFENSMQSKNSVEKYKLKYGSEIKKGATSDNSDLSSPLNDKKWTMRDKLLESSNTDLPDEPKAGFYDEEGNEVAAEG